MADSYPAINGTGLVTTGAAQTISGAKTFLAGSATSVPVVVQAAGSQTSDIFQVQGSTGTVLASFARGGQLALSDTGLTNGDGTGAKVWLRTTGSGYFLNSVAADRVLVLKGAASQTGNLQEWQDSAGTIISYMRPTGDAVFSGVNIGGYLASVPSTRFAVWCQGSTEKGILVRGAASQSGNLFEVQNSAGTTLMSVTSGGNLWFSPGVGFYRGIEMGANDSGGTGYRMLRVAN